jgi:hypothetical protein
LSKTDKCSAVNYYLKVAIFLKSILTNSKKNYRAKNK